MDCVDKSVHVAVKLLFTVAIMTFSTWMNTSGSSGNSRNWYTVFVTFI